MPTATWSARQNLRYNEVNSGYPVIFPDGFTTDAVGNIADYRTINATIYQDPRLAALLPMQGQPTVSSIPNVSPLSYVLP